MRSGRLHRLAGSRGRVGTRNHMLLLSTTESTVTFIQLQSINVTVEDIG